MAGMGEVVVKTKAPELQQCSGCRFNVEGFCHRRAPQPISMQPNQAVPAWISWPPATNGCGEGAPR